MALRTAVIVAAALAAFQVPLPAQLPDPIYCPRGPGENDFDWQARCEVENRAAMEKLLKDSERRRNEVNARLKDTERQRAILESQPPLPAARNRLLGRWQSAAARPGAAGDPLGTRLNGCGLIGDGTAALPIGDGSVEFEPGRWAIHDRVGRNDLGAVSYRGGPNGAVVVLPARGSQFSLLSFEFETPDRIRLTTSGCTFVRTNASVPAGRAAAPAATPSSRATGANPAPAAAAGQAASSAAFEEALAKKWRGRMGHDCPNGEHVAVDSCASERPNAPCVVVRVGQPPRNGALVTFTETYSALTKRIASCKLRPLRVVNGTLGFAP